MNRRQFTAFLGTLPFASLASTTPASAAHVDVRPRLLERARQLAAAAYVPPPNDVPDKLRFGYDEHKDIQYRRDKAIFRNDPNGLELHAFHRGFFFLDRVDLYVVEGDKVEKLLYSPELFDFAQLRTSPLQLRPESFGEIGFAGLRVLAKFQPARPAREFLVFLGASYFRATGEGMRYGLSARGLAIRTGDTVRGEEFPRFSEFYVERPEHPGAIRIHALMDSPSVAGVFTFRAEPGKSTRMRVEASLFPRVDLDHVGIAPLTSMYWYAFLERRDVDEFRPRIHDSDGLTVHSGNERVWRPLASPYALRYASFPAPELRSYGLHQRMRGLPNYQDLEARYDLRPSAWVEPGPDWPAGKVELVEIPSNSEYEDNIVAYWRLAAPLKKGEQLDYQYRLVWADDTARRAGRLTVEHSMSGATGDNWRRFVVDFRGSSGGPAPSSLKAEITASSGEIRGMSLVEHAEINGIRMTFVLVPAGPKATIRALLKQGEVPISEAWVYDWEKRP